MRSKRTFLLIPLLSILLVSCQQQEPWIKNTNTGDALGTSYSILYLTRDSLDLRQGIDSVFQVVNASMSTYIPSSDISRINKGDSTVVVDDMFREVMAISREVYNETNGYFDPTVGILVNAWGFGPGVQTSMDSATVKSLRSFVGLDKIKVTEDFRIKKKRRRYRSILMP